MRLVLAFSGALLLLAVGCKRDSRSSGTAKAVASDAGAAAPASPPSSTLVASARAANGLDVELQSLTQRWNAALAERNATALAPVYGARVSLYGTLVDRKTALKMKSAALTDDYTQSIGPVTLDMRDPAHPRALFDKTWNKKGKELTVRGSLGFGNEDGRWVVTDESDAKADSLLLDEHGQDNCLGLVHAAVLSTEDGESFRHPPYGTVYVCGPPECETFQIAGYLEDKNGMQRMATFDVDPKTGVVSHVAPIVADAAIVSRMKAACAK
jgi:hypothetical protein